MNGKRTLLRGASALLGEDLVFDGRPLDVLIEGDRIAAIEPAGTIGNADRLVEMAKRLLVPGWPSAFA